MELRSFIFWHHWGVISCMHKWNSLVKHFITKSGALSMIFLFFFFTLSRSLSLFFFFFFVLESAFKNLTLWVRRSTSTPKIQTLLTQDLRLGITEAIVRIRWTTCFPNIQYVESNPRHESIFFFKRRFSIHCKVLILGFIFVWEMLAGHKHCSYVVRKTKKKSEVFYFGRSGTYINSGLCKICT